MRTSNLTTYPANANGRAGSSRSPASAYGLLGDTANLAGNLTYFYMVGPPGLEPGTKGLCEQARFLIVAERLSILTELRVVELGANGLVAD